MSNRFNFFVIVLHLLETKPKTRSGAFHEKKSSEKQSPVLYPEFQNSR